MVYRDRVKSLPFSTTIPSPKKDSYQCFLLFLPLFFSMYKPLDLIFQVSERTTRGSIMNALLCVSSSVKDFTGH